MQRKTPDKHANELEPGLERLAALMDSAFRIPGLGWRIGLDAILGLIPGLGDTASTLVSLYILTAASRYRVRKVTIARMAFNILIDYLVGLIPIVGDLFDVWWKANQRNVELLRRRATAPADTARRMATGDWLFIVGVMAVLLGLLVGTIVLVAYAARYLAQHVAMW